MEKEKGYEKRNRQKKLGESHGLVYIYSNLIKKQRLAFYLVEMYLLSAQNEKHRGIYSGSEHSNQEKFYWFYYKTKEKYLVKSGGKLLLNMAMCGALRRRDLSKLCGNDW